MLIFLFLHLGKRKPRKCVRSLRSKKRDEGNDIKCSATIKKEDHEDNVDVKADSGKVDSNDAKDVISKETDTGACSEEMGNLEPHEMDSDHVNEADDNHNDNNDGDDNEDDNNDDNDYDDKDESEDMNAEDGISAKRRKFDYRIAVAKSGVYQCDVCLENFQSWKDVMKHHKVEHTAKKHFPCPECGKFFTSKGGWRAHNSVMHNKFTERSLTCKFCGEVFLRSPRYTSHLEKCQKEYTFHCEICDKYFRSWDSLDTHKLVEHSSEEVLTQLKCSTCEEVFGSKNAREKHEECHKNPNNQCNECQKWFLSPEACEKHKRSHGPYPSRTEMTCQYCNKTFVHRKAFMTHLELHRDTKLSQKFECQICGKQCKTQTTYNAHKKLHLPDEEKPYHCDICGKGFVTNRGKDIHQMTHSDEKFVFCEFCGEGYKEQRHLKVSISVTTFLNSQ